MAVDNRRSRSHFPTGNDYERYVQRRKRFGTIWATLFLAATMVGIIALSALLLNIINDSFGYVAVQNRVDPGTLVVDYFREQVLAAPRQVISEDDDQLAAGVAARANAIGFFGYGVFNRYTDSLRLQSIDGISPSAVTVTTGEYLLSRPLFLYTSETALQEQEAIAAFVGYYINHVNDIIGDVGYFALTEERLNETLERWQRTTGMTGTTADNLLPATGDVIAAGSTTVAPITQAVADAFTSETGYSGEIIVESIGTEAGFVRFCQEGSSDIADASRAMERLALSACRTSGIEPLEFVIGGDGIAVVVSTDNDFVEDLSREQLQQIVTVADRWSDVNPDWPDLPILRFVPSEDSGTLTFFVSQVFGDTLEEQDTETLIALLTAHISQGRVRALEADLPLAERTDEQILELIYAEVVQPRFVKSWTLLESVLNREDIEAEVAMIPNATLEFRNWISWNFISSPQSSNPEMAGIRTAILGSLWVTLIAFLVSVPLGVGAAIYLEEYGSGNWLDNIIETNINNLAGVPSIIYGMLGLAIFVRAFEPFTSGTALGVTDPTTANGRTIVSAGLTLGLLILPLVIINGREAIRAVPRALREASYGIGATKWQTVWNHVLPSAIPGILTGVILAVSRAFGETAPLIVVGVSTFIVVDPSGPFSKFTTLTAQIYQWTSRPQPEFQHLAAAGIIILLILLLSLNATAIWLRNRYSRRI